MSYQLDHLISQPQLRRLLGGVSDTTIWRWRNSGALPAPVTINGRNYFRASDLQDLEGTLFATAPKKKTTRKKNSA